MRQPKVLLKQYEATITHPDGTTEVFTTANTTGGESELVGYLRALPAGTTANEGSITKQWYSISADVVLKHGTAIVK